MGIISEEYFDWMCSLVCSEPVYSFRDYSRLFARLHSIRFTWTIITDRNREVDGQYLRIKFANQYGYNENYISDILDGPASVLEMMIGLALRVESEIMSDEDYGDRTYEWFWTMICNMELDTMVNNMIDYDYIDYRVDIMLNRKYNSNGSGGALFKVYNPRNDMRVTDIWYQMQWYLVERYPVY